MARRVLLYARVNPADEGGVQSVVDRLAHHLQARGHGVTVAWAFPVPAGRRDRFLPCRPVVIRGGWPAPRSTLWAAGALLRLASALLRLRPHVVNVHYVTGEALYFALLKPFFRYRLVLSFHGSDVLRTQADDAPLLPRILPRADAITAVSRLTAARLRALPGVDPARVRVIPNGVDREFWDGAGSAAGVDARVPMVLSVGRLDRVKGHDVLLRAFPRVLDRVPGARLVIVGDGGDRAALAALAAELGIAQAVRFAGQLRAAEVRGHLRAARVFVLPSRSEGLPIALLEAMAAGVPVVATAAGGTPEVLEGGCGVLVPPEDAAALGEAVAALLLDAAAQRSLSRTGRQRAAAFSAPAALAAYEELLCSGGGQTGVKPGTEPLDPGELAGSAGDGTGSNQGQTGVKPGTEAVHSGP